MLFVVDASGSMAARQRMSAVKGAVLSLLLDAYQRRDKVGLVTFRGAGAELALPPTSSVEAAAARLESLPTGGRTPLAAGLLQARDVLRVERLRDPARRRAGRGRHRRTGHRRPGAGRARRAGRAAARRRRRRLRRRGLRVGARCGSGSPGSWPVSWAAPAVTLEELRRRLASRGWSRTSSADFEEGRVMPQGQPSIVPDDGLTTRQRRNRPLLVVHTGDGKGKSTAAFGLALRGLEPGLADRGVPVRQVREVEGRRGERAARAGGDRARAAPSTGTRWARAGPGCSASRAPSRPRGRRPRGLGAGQAGPGRRDVQAVRARRVHLPAELGLGRRRRGRRRAAPPGRAPSTSSSPAGTRPQAGRRRRPRTEMTKVKHPMDAGQKGQRGIEW